MRLVSRASLILYTCLCCMQYQYTSKSYALILRSNIIVEQCEEARAENCFYKLFEQMGSICGEKILTFKCHHYRYLDQCFSSNVGICSAKTIGYQGKKAYMRRYRDCIKQNDKDLREMRRRPFQLLRNRPPNELQFISVIGYLEEQCSHEAQRNCSMTDYKAVMQECTREIRFKSGSNFINFDRHQFLRLRLETSKNLLRYSETKRDIECLIIRSTLTELYAIQHRYCFQAIITRCLCELHGFDVSCGIDCHAIKLISTFDERLSWEQFKNHLLFNSHPKSFTKIPVLMITIVIVGLKF